MARIRRDGVTPSSDRRVHVLPDGAHACPRYAGVCVRRYGDEYRATREWRPPTVDDRRRPSNREAARLIDGI